MKEKYVAPVIEIETLKLAEYCAGACNMGAKFMPSPYADTACLEASGFDVGSYCYNMITGIIIFGS